MKFRLGLIALVAVVSLPALATSGTSPVLSEGGDTYHAMPALKSRAEVLKEHEAWQRHPLTSSGWRQVGGEVGWEYVGVPSTLTRAQVYQELMQARRNPVSADGWLTLGSEAGGVYVGTAGNAASAMAARATASPAGRVCAREPGGVVLSSSGHQTGTSGSQC